MPKLLLFDELGDTRAATALAHSESGLTQLTERADPLRGKRSFDAAGAELRTLSESTKGLTERTGTPLPCIAPLFD